MRTVLAVDDSRNKPVLMPWFNENDQVLRRIRFRLFSNPEKTPEGWTLENSGKSPETKTSFLRMGDTRFELVTPTMSTWCSNQLS